MPRLVVSILAGALAAGVVAWWLLRHPEYAGGDFGYVWRAAVHILHGRNPYLAMPPGARYGVDGPFLYPLTAAVIALPTTGFSVVVASALFLGVSTALAALGLTGAGWWRLAALISPPYILALVAANWPPIMLAAATIPWLGWLIVAKPNLGVMVFAARPGRRVVIGGAVLVAASLALFPNWPAQWFSHVRAETIHHRPPLQWELGAIGLLGILRWRTAEGRLLTAFTVIPVSAFPYDFLMLWLIPRTSRQMMALTASAWLVAPANLAFDGRASEGTLHVVRLMLVIGMIVPATIIVLRNPNVGMVPTWVERGTHRWPRWLRGGQSEPELRTDRKPYADIPKQL